MECVPVCRVQDFGKRTMQPEESWQENKNHLVRWKSTEENHHSEQVFELQLDLPIVESIWCPGFPVHHSP